jgi:hypothetical protein
MNNTLAIVEAFKELPDHRCGSGLRHAQSLCLALFTLAVSAGCRGFLSISDRWHSYHCRNPSCSSYFLVLKTSVVPNLNRRWI